MNGYIALKNITLSGTEYLAGETVPADAVLASRANALIRNGMIGKIDDAEARTGTQGEISSPEVCLPILLENGVLHLSVSELDVQKAVMILQMKQDDAVAAVNAEVSENALVIIDACSKSQTIKKAVRERSAQLDPGDGDGE